MSSSFLALHSSDPADGHNRKILACITAQDSKSGFECNRQYIGKDFLELIIKDSPENAATERANFVNDYSSELTNGLKMNVLKFRDGTVNSEKQPIEYNLLTSPISLVLGDITSQDEYLKYNKAQ